MAPAADAGQRATDAGLGLSLFINARVGHTPQVSGLEFVGEFERHELPDGLHEMRFVPRDTTFAPYFVVTSNAYEAEPMEMVQYQVMGTFGASTKSKVALASGVDRGLRLGDRPTLSPMPLHSSSRGRPPDHILSALSYPVSSR